MLSTSTVILQMQSISTRKMLAISKLQSAPCRLVRGTKISSSRWHKLPPHTSFRHSVSLLCAFRMYLRLVGYHPWFSHHISLRDPPLSKGEHYRALLKPGDAHEDSFQAVLEHLPEPTSLTSILSTLKQNLTTFSNAMIGEIGLDRAFRVPVNYYTTPRHLTRFTIPLEHQLAVLEAQLDLAVEMKRNVSIHSVKSQQATIQLLDSQREKYGAEKWNTISVDMHSCGLSVESWRDLEVR